MSTFNFLDEFLAVTADAEAPTSYLTWGAYMTVASILRHRVKVTIPGICTTIVPNLYVLLVGDSGQTRKSVSLKLCNKLVSAVNNTKLIQGRASIQAILTELANVKRVDRELISDAAGLLYSEEFDAFLVKDPSAGGILCDIYDYKENHEGLLKGEGCIKLKNLTVNLFAATNVIFLKSMFSQTDIYGGLVARTILVMESKARQKRSLLQAASNTMSWDRSIEHLSKLATIAGDAKFTSDATAYYDSWYMNTDFGINESKTGYEWRMHTLAIKLSIIIAACDEDFNLLIKLEHVQKAIDLVTSLQQNYHKIISAASFSPNSTRQTIKGITQILYSNPDQTFTRAVLLQKLMEFSEGVDAESFDKAIATLDQAGFVKQGGMTVPEYKLSQMGREKIAAIQLGGGH